METDEVKRAPEATYPLRLWRVDNGGAVYWILGNLGTPEEMAAAIEEVEGVTFEGEGWEPLSPDDIREVDESEARRTFCRFEGEPGLDMWTAAQEHARDGFGRVVACSEWP